MTPTQPSQAEAAEREKFEASLRKINPAYEDSLLFGLMADGVRYSSFVTQQCWRLWLARAELAEVAAPVESGPSYGDLVAALAECRDAFPVPGAGHPLEHEWAEAIGYPMSVPAYVKLAARRVPVALPAEPVAWSVWWGIGQMQKNSVHFERKTAEEVAANIKSVTEIRPLYATPAPKQGDAKDAPRYRLLDTNDRIQAEDEFIQDDCVTWIKPVGWEIGARYGSVFKAARRPILASKATAAGEGK